MNFITENWAEIALAIITLLGSLTAITESKKDDKIVNILSRIIQAVLFGKNRKK
tara:strand:+ start:292 stop:453 length:162 start_codon:yes stop_codon:yes gene_type:complete